MPYTEKEKKLHAALVKKYGPKKSRTSLSCNAKFNEA